VTLMRPVRLLANLALIAIATASFAEGPTLKIGNPAPPIKVTKWAKGTPVASFEKGKTYVVEFWATWCPPCRESIPHLTELAKKFAGKVTFIGVDCSEQDQDDSTCFPAVAKFVKDFGDRMEYNVAYDGSAAMMNKNWMDAAGEGGIPTAFVVDATGAIAWIGHPMDGLDEVLGRLMNGTYDRKAEIVAKARKVAEEQRAAQEQDQNAKEAEVLKPVLEAYRAKKFPETVAAIEKLIAGTPELEPLLGVMKYVCLAPYDSARSNVYARRLMSSLYKEDPIQLNQLAWVMVAPESPVKNPDLKLSLEIVNQALVLAKDDAGPRASILDTAAAIYAHQGNFDKAISSEQEAIKLADTVPDFREDQKTGFKKALERYQQKKV